MDKRAFSFGIPDKIGGYKITSLLYRGAKSSVFLASHSDTAELLALKAVSSHKSSLRAEGILKEAQIISMVSHPNIIKLHGYGYWDQGVYIAMEFAYGKSLWQLITDEVLSLNEIVQIVKKVGCALEYLHGRGIIHKDLKPENILLSSDGEVKVIDFGISSLSHETNFYQKSYVIGSPAYMSPEQQENKGIGYSTDIYSLGIIIYEMLLGSFSKGKVCLSLIPEGLRPILSKALQYDPKKRYQDIGDFLLDFSNYVDSEDFLKDIRPVDRLCDLREVIKDEKQNLCVLNRDLTSLLEVEYGHIENQEGSSIYFENFLTEKNNYRLIFVESPDSHNIFDLVRIKSIIACNRSLDDEQEFIKAINKQLVDMHTVIGRKRYACSLISFSAKTQRMIYYACGNRPLWVISKNNLREVEAEGDYLGISDEMICREVKIPWKPGDSVIVGSLGIPDNERRNAMKDLLQDYLARACFQNLALMTEHFFRDVLKDSGSLTIISLKRTK